MKCLICENDQKLKFLSDYKLEINEDHKYFKDAKVFRCEDCDFSFVDPMPSDDTLSYFYEKVYRSDGRPPYLVSENYEDQKKHYLEDKNLSYLIYLTSLVDLKKIKKLYDFGGGDGDLGYALKKKFPQLQLFCTEHDSHCERILKDREYKNLKNFETISEKFDLIVCTHSLEHITNISSIFKKMNNLLNPGGYIFFEVPNCSEEYWSGRPYDSPHLHFYTKTSFEKLAKIHKFQFINFSFSSYSFKKDHMNQQISKKNYYKMKSSNFSIGNLKRFFKKFLPKKLISLRQDILQIKNSRSDEKLNWFINNTGDNCYIRGVLKKIN